MIPDWDTNHLFLSDRLEADEPALFAGLRFGPGRRAYRHHPRHQGHLVPGLHAGPA